MNEEHHSWKVEICRPGKYCRKAASKGISEETYNIIRGLVVKYGSQEQLVSDKKGEPITKDQKEKNRWVKHFEELLNRLTRVTLLQLEGIWNSKQLSVKIKVGIFSTNVKTFPDIGAETCRTTTTIIIKELQLFINSYLRKIL